MKVKEYDSLKQIHDKDEYTKYVEYMIERVISEISIKNNIDTDELPLTVHEKINHAIDTINDDGSILTISTFTLNNVTITSRHPDHYVNLSELCQAGYKKFNDWFRLESTKELITELETATGMSSALLVEIKRDCSWIHPDLAVQLAHWISPSFALKVTRWIRRLFDEVEIDIALLKDQEKHLLLKEHRIKQLEEICLSKQRRVEYPERNVIYMLTTDDHIKRRTYIIGKAKNLTTRLGTYNKTCNHTVIYYRECKNEDDMTTIENLVLSKLKDYREQANRDRFILPDDQHISLFTSTIDQCIDFV
jgi:hypothetical protein